MDSKYLSNMDSQRIPRKNNVEFNYYVHWSNRNQSFQPDPLDEVFFPPLGKRKNNPKKKPAFPIFKKIPTNVIMIIIDSLQYCDIRNLALNFPFFSKIITDECFLRRPIMWKEIESSIFPYDDEWFPPVYLEKYINRQITKGTFVTYKNSIEEWIKLERNYNRFLSDYRNDFDKYQGPYDFDHHNYNMDYIHNHPNFEHDLGFVICTCKDCVEKSHDEGYYYDNGIHFDPDY
jgi:hypothetical protein